MNGSISDTNRSADALWAAVARLVGADHELQGELSASADGRRTAYVATRRTPGRELVLLVVDRGAEPDAHELSFHEILDETVPARDLYCRHCANRLETWAAACPACGRNTALATAIPSGQVSDLSIRTAVSAALGADSAALGSLPCASGDVAVFARSARTGEIVALTLERVGGATGPTRAVPIVRLHRYDPTPSDPVGPKRTSSPHSGEIGPLAARDQSQLTTTPGQPPGPLTRVCTRCGSRYEAAMRFCSVDGSELREIGVHEDLVGRVVGGKFRVEKLLGEGGMGRVYLAVHERIGRRCALKVLAPHLVGDPSSIKRFDGEARNASRIVHPSVAVVYDFEETPDGLVYLVLEYVDGETLGAILGRSADQRLGDATRAIRIARDVADALHAAHELGIVHRDLKPDNIMLTQNDRVKVVDFGIAKAIEDTGAGAQRGVTRTGFIVGTPRYMSPEQLAGTHVDARTDIFALGCVLYEMVTGRPAYDAPVTGERTPRQHERFRDAPRGLDAIILKAMSRSADGRYQTAREMRDALDALLAGRRTASRRVLWTWIALGVVVVAAIAVAAATLFRRPIHTPARTPSVASPTVLQVPAPVPSVPTIPAADTPLPATSKTPPAQPKPTAPQPSSIPVQTPPPPSAAPTVVAESAHTSDDAGRETQYLVHVKNVVREEWLQALQGYQPNGSERAEYALIIDETGQVLEVRAISVSDQAAYDDPAESGLQRIHTFGPPPPHGSELHVLFRGAGLTITAGSFSTPAGPIR